MLETINNHFILHTNLDNIETGVKYAIVAISWVLQMQKIVDQTGDFKKLVTFTPIAQAEKVRTALLKRNAGNISNYSECSFNVEGQRHILSLKPNQSCYRRKKIIRHTEN